MSYYTISIGGRDEVTVERSRFIASTAHVTTEDDARAFLQSIKKEFHDARHNCSAWVLGDSDSENDLRPRSSDDGEPGGTAGMPILNMLRAKHLTNSIIVVTRYFGGIKLGTGGLTRAYGNAAELGIAASKIARVDTCARLAVKLSYPMLAPIQNYLRQKESRVADIGYAEDVIIEILIDKAKLETIKNDIVNLTAGNVQFEDKGLEKVMSEE